MLFFLSGQDAYRIQQESLSQRERFFGQEGFQNTRKFDASERGVFSWKEFAEAVRDGGLFSEKRCVIMDNIFSLSEDEKEKLKQWLEGASNPSENGSILCIFQDVKPDKRMTLFKILQKKAQCREFLSLSEQEVMRYMQEMIQKRFPKIIFEQKAADLLVRGCGSDLFRLEGDLEKLGAYALETKRVTEPDVQLLCSFGIYDDIFGALEAISRGDKKKALQFLWRQVKKGEHPIYLLTMCAYQIRTMLLVGECLERGITIPGVVAREAKIHPFVAQKTITCIRDFGIDRARKAFQLLGRMDVAVKTGKMDAGLALEEFVLRS